MPVIDGAKLQEVQAEIDAVVKQIKRVEFNSNAVEAAIAGHGTYRGYSGEDVFLKNNLSVVQKEMMKQLKRKERSLTHKRQKLEVELGIARATPPVPQPEASNTTTDGSAAGERSTQGIQHVNTHPKNATRKRHDHQGYEQCSMRNKRSTA